MKPSQRIDLWLHLKALPQYLLVLTSLFVVAWFTGKYIEAVCFAVTFCALRYRFTDILHCKTTPQCILLTNGIVIVVTPLILPLTNSVFGGLFAGFFVNYFATLIASSIFRKSEQSELQVLREQTRIHDIYSMDELSLRKFCKAYNLDTSNEEIVVQRLIYHRKGKDLYDKIGYSKPQMLRRERQIEKILNIKLTDR